MPASPSAASPSAASPGPVPPQPAASTAPTIAHGQLRSRSLGAWSVRDRLAVLAGLLVPLGVAALLVPFRGTVTNTQGALVLVVAVVAVAANGHRLAGVVAAASAAIWFDYFLTRPYEHLTITHRTDVETTLLLLVVGAAVTELAVRGRRQRVLAGTDAAYLAAVADVTDLVGSGAEPRVVSERVAAHLIGIQGLRSCRFERTSFGGLPRLEPDGRLRWGETYWDLDQYDMPTKPVELLALAHGEAYGRFVLEAVPGTVAPLAARRVATILGGLVGVAVAQRLR